MSSESLDQLLLSPMARVQAALERLRQSPCTPVLLIGPPGAGKQHTAELLHRRTHGHEASAPFVRVDCAGLTPAAAAIELFGHERVASNSLAPAPRGLVELAHGGTLLLQDASALALPVQALLLKFIDGMLRPSSAEREPLALRVVVTVTRQPPDLLRAGLLHEGLYRRLAVFRLTLPALHERREELPALCRVFVEEFASRMHKPVSGLDDQARAALANYSFPGNVRELRSLIERAVLSCPEGLIQASDLALDDDPVPSSRSAHFFEVDATTQGAPPPLEVVERAYVRRVLEHTGGRRMEAAQLLGISYPTFLKRLRELDVQSGPARALR